MLVDGALNGSSRWGTAAFLLVAAISVSVSTAATSGATTTSMGETPSPVVLFPQCENETIGGDLSQMGDSFCDMFANNVAECGFDGGDCCECTCVDQGKEYSCLDFECLDTSAECYVAPSPTTSPIASPLEVADSSAMRRRRALSPASMALASGGVWLIALLAATW